MWPFSKQPRNSITPPVDLDTPVTNPELVKAVDVFAVEQGPEQLEALLTALTQAVFLIATLMDEAKFAINKDQGSGTMEKGSRIKILEVEGPNGERVLPLFTDWDEIRKFTDQQVSTLVMPASQAWSFALQNYGAAVVNPGGKALPLDRAQVTELAQHSQAR
ncbi:MAG: SseB family protein [Phycisphaerales bacterium]|nr:SseB family protein [Phycisphaerales bacterium]